MQTRTAHINASCARLLARTILFGLLLCPTTAWAQTAVELLQASGVEGGLVVVLGCDDAKLLTALRAQDAYLVQGLDADPAKVDAARRTVQTKGLYGPVSVLHVDGPQLPYVDNLVNLLVVSSPCQVAQAERKRVLVPNGVLMERIGGRWKRTVKPVPAEIDEWPHFLHGPDNNAVAEDRVVAPPHHVKWIADPKFGRNHEKSPNVNAAVSASGRLFAIVDEGPISSIALPPQWTLVARDAFNGLLLWKKPPGGQRAIGNLLAAELSTASPGGMPTRT
jgi:SAM-dependent methyltransferase